MKLVEVKQINPFVGCELKPVAIPEDFVLIQDTREQQGLFDGDTEGLTVIHQALPYGDYSIRGFQNRICFERKRMSDFYSFIGKERDRTIQKMQQFNRMDFVGLVIEASEEDILAGYCMSRLSPEVARQALVSFEIRYGLHIYCSPCRDSIRRWLLDRATKFYKTQREVKGYEIEQECSKVD